MSKLDLCNEALSEIMCNTISSLTDNTSKEAKMCNLFYDKCRKEILRSFDWNFAKKKVQATTVADADSFGWSYAYQYPSDCLNLIAVTDIPSPNAFNQIGGNYNVTEENLFDVGLSSDGNYKLIFSNIQNAYLVYIADLQDTSKFDDLFKSAFVYLLSNKLCNSLSGNPEIAKYTLEMYMYMLNYAKTVNAQEGNQFIKTQNKYILSRSK